MKPNKIPSENGYISSVIHATASNTKLAILCPGFLDSKNYHHLVRLAELLNNHGYDVIRFDPTGTWDSDGDISSYTNSQYIKDVKIVLEYMLKGKKYKEILLGGHSRGGQISILYAAQDQRITKVLGIMASFGTVEGKRREEWQEKGFHVSTRDLPFSNEGEKEFIVPFTHVLDQDNYDALNAIKKVRAEVILIGGEKDELVTPDDIQELYENANEPKKFTIIEDIGHDYRLREEDIEIVNRNILNKLISEL